MCAENHDCESKLYENEPRPEEVNEYYNKAVVLYLNAQEEKKKH